MSFSQRWWEAGRRHADAPAVRDADTVLSYCELDDLSRAIGGTVAARVSPGAVVGVVVPKTVWSYAAMFGVVTGARTALLLDPTDPPDRWAAHCARAGATLACAEDEAARTALASVGLTVLGPDHVTSADDDRHGDRDGGDDVDAWVVCTSGSTGVPKLVAISDTSLVQAWDRNVARAERWGDVGPALLVVAPLSSVAIRMSIMLARITGACAVLVDTARTPPDRLLDLIDEHGVRRLDLNPWLLRSIVRAAAARGRGNETIASIGTSGGPLTAADCRAVWRWFPNASLRNHYGATEFSGVAGLELAPGTELSHPDAMALVVDPDVAVRIARDDRGTPAPPGEQGEIWIWTERVEGRYVDGPERGVQSADVDDLGRRWLRTGDLGRLTADGRVHVDGRDDARVKVNGIAVDLNAVTAAVRALDGVGDAEVSVLERDDDTRLVAWVIADGASFLSVRDLRAGLATRLPRSMMPHIFRAVSSIPRLRTGKPDRVALRAAAGAALPVAVDRVLPRTPLERELAARFETVLDCPTVGVNESFFELGGDSLGALELVAGIVDRHAVPDARRPALESAMLTDGTVAALGAVLQGTAPDGPGTGVDEAVLLPDGVGLLVLGAGSSDDVPIVLLPGGGQDPLAFRPLVRRLAGHRVWTLTPRGFRSRAAPDRTIEQMAVRFADALLARDPRGDVVVGGFSFGAVVAQALTTELVARGARVRCLVLIDAPRPGTRPEPGAARAVGQPTRAPLWVRIPRGTAFRIRFQYLRATAGIVRRTGWVQGEAFLYRSSRLLRRWRPRSFAGPTVVVRSEVTAAEGLPADLGWSGLCTGPFETIDLPGNHFAVLLEPSVARIGQVLAAAAVG